MLRTLKLFDNLIKTTIKEVARQFSVSEKCLHSWKNLLIEEGPKIFSSLKPGRKKEEFSSLQATEKLLIYETVNGLLIDEKRHEGKNRKFSPEVKEKILKERGRLKEEFSLCYEAFSELLGIDSGSIRLWSRKVREEGVEGLEAHPRIPRHRPKKLPQELINEIVACGQRWKRRHRRRVKLTEFGARFRWKHHKLLARYGRTNLSNKTISRYLKEAGLYTEKEERPKGKRGAFRYYFPGAQLLIDSTILRFLGIKVRLIAVMDALSRNIFHQSAFLGETVEAVIKSTRASLKRARGLGLKVLSFLSDHGCSYKAQRVWQYLKEEGLYRVFSHPYWPEGKAPLERYFRTLKEGLSGRWEVVLFLIKGMFLWLKESVLLVCLNLVLIGFSGKYKITQNPGIDGKSPQERLHKELSPAYQEATRRVLEEEERKSQLKVELIGALYEEFGFTSMEKREVERYLSRCRKESIQEAAEALRRKLVVEKLPPLSRWYYLSKVARTIEDKKKEEEILQAKEVILKEKLQEEIREKEREERRRREEERLWYETHPEEALEEAIEWQLVFWNNPFANIHYDNMVSDNLKKVLMQHSSLTAGLKVDKICKSIEEKDSLENEKVIKKGLPLPPQDKLNEVKEVVCPDSKELL